MALAEYRRKRSFSKTPEPKGKAGPKKPRKLSFVVQKHAATRLHYDLRLELDGVLKSWAVPKGPSLDPTVRALAVEVEDHPLDYAAFEGVIPEGNYGAGEVIVWDRGAWEPVDDPHAGLTKGHLKFQLSGKKLRGLWTLARMRPRPGDSKNNWLLIKHKDDAAREGDGYGLTERMPRSVKTGKKIEDLASPAKAKKKAARRSPVKRVRAGSPAVAEMPRATRAAMPRELEPQLATLVEAPPSGTDWVHELKFDGYRLLAFKDGQSVRLITRNGHDWTRRFPAVEGAVKRLGAGWAVLDGEVVALNDRGVPDFQALQNAIRDRSGSRLSYYVFDLLHLDGVDTRGSPLLERKEALRGVLRAAPDLIQYSEHFAEDGAAVLSTVCKGGYEGVVSKRADAAYASGRNRLWTKTRCGRGQEFVIGGYTDPGGSRTGFGALLIGYFEGPSLRYAGRVGTGFDERVLGDLIRKLREREQTDPAFDNPASIPGRRQAHWVRPDLVAEVTFTEMTSDGVLRHPVFHGLRLDKPAREVRLEHAAHLNGSAKEKPVAQRTKTAKTAKPARRGSDSAQKPLVAGVAISSPDRMVYPGTGVSKLDLARYYEAIADLMLPHVAGRPLMVVRCPEGEGKQCFHQRHWTKMMPGPLSGVPIKERDETEPHLVLRDAAGLVALAQMGVLEIHPWGCRADAVETPDRLVFDLDPGPGVAWKDLVRGAVRVREVLAELGLESFARVTGGKGIHAVVPIRAKAGWDEVKAFCKGVAERVASADPAAYTTNMSKARRDKRIFVDYHRNGRGATAIGLFSTRARPGAPVCVPLTWKELQAARRIPTVTPVQVLKGRARFAAAWKGFESLRQSITARAMRAVAAR